jgi:hypothetical protein
LKSSIKRKAENFILLLAFVILNSTNATSQDPSGRILKIGYNPFYPGENKISSIHIESERLKKNKSHKTIGFGISQLRIVDYNDTISMNSTFNGTQNITYVYYKISYYPFQGLLKSKPFNGLMLSLNPCIFYQDFKIHPDSYGFGIMFGVGFQYLIKRRISIGVEGNIGILSKVDRLTHTNPLTAGGYYTAKIGYLLKKKSQ